MARRKTLPESVRAKLALAERLAALRSELYGDRGGPEMARRLGIPVRTWYNYEGGVTVPAEVILKIIELTAVEAGWLLHGEEPKFRHQLTDRGSTGGHSHGALSGHCCGRPSNSSKRTSRRWPGRDEMITGSRPARRPAMRADRIGFPYDSRTARSTSKTWRPRTTW